MSTTLNEISWIRICKTVSNEFSMSGEMENEITQQSTFSCARQRNRIMSTGNGLATSDDDDDWHMWTRGATTRQVIIRWRTGMGAKIPNWFGRVHRHVVVVVVEELWRKKKLHIETKIKLPNELGGDPELDHGQVRDRFVLQLAVVPRESFRRNYERINRPMTPPN